MIGTGFLVGRDLLINFKFDPAHPYAGCRICGAVYQSTINRTGSTAGLTEWRVLHNKRHTEKEHLELVASGRNLTPEAAQKLATYGIIDFTGLVLDNELAHAYAEAPRAPLNDVEGS